MLSFLKEKLLSRKFLAAMAAVAGAATGIISWSAALDVVLVWIAVQGAADIVTQIKSSK